MNKGTLLLAAGILFSASTIASAQHRNPSTDWNGSYQFSSPQQVQLRLLQAEMIERKRSDYYEEFGRSNATVYYNSTIEGDVHNDNSRKIKNKFPDGYNQPLDQSDRTTTAVGAINSTAVDISRGSNIQIDSGAHSTGCQDGGIRISGGPGGSSQTGC